MRKQEHQVAVVGAGLSGLVAAYELTKNGADVHVLERASGPGGRVQTVRSGGYTIDLGATAVGSGYDDYLSLAAELGLELVPSAQCLAIPRDGRLHVLDMSGLARSGLTTRLLSPRAKLRAARLVLDVVRARRRGYLDNTDLGQAAPIDTETAAEYAERRLGPELGEYLVAPLMRTMVIADPDRVSKVQLLSGLANSFGGTWLAPAGGAAALVEALASRLQVFSDCNVERVQQSGTGVTVTWRDHVARRQERAYDAAVIACPLPVAARICPDPGGELARLRATLDYTQVIVVSVGTTRRPECPAFMTLLPPSEDPEIALFFLNHNQHAGRAPAGHGLFTFYYEMTAAAARIDDDDTTLVDRACRPLFALFPELEGTVDFAYVHRWPLGLPHVAVGTFAEIGRFVHTLDPASPIQFAGDYMSETGMNTAVALGRRAARALSRSHGTSRG